MRAHEMQYKFACIFNEYCEYPGGVRIVSKDNYKKLIAELRETLGDHVKISVVHGRLYIALYGPRGGLLENRPIDKVE